MQLAHRAALNGVQLDEIDPRIIIKGIEGGAGKETVTSVSTGLGDGTRITGRHRDTVDVSVRFSMNIRRNVLAERGMVLEAINAWAGKGGWLTINYKPNRTLWVDEVITPGEGDLWKRLNEFTITFRAHAIPFWQEETANVVTFGGSASSGSRSVTIEGSAWTQCDAELANTSGMTINSCRVVIGGNTMTFSGLGLGGNETLVIDHQDGLLRIRIRNGGSYRSVMAARSGADDYKVTPGMQTCSFSADRACRMTVSWRCRYL